MSYRRVIPRDLFNEAKLLKCLGQLALLIHEGVRWPLTLDMDNDRAGFVIEQHLTGDLYCVNLKLWLGNKRVHVHTTYNSKSPYPMSYYDDNCGEGDVFNDDGSLSSDFTDWLDNQAAKGRGN